MSLSTDLMGLGVAPLQAERTASGGTGPLTILSAGSNFATSTRMGAAQFVVSNTDTDGTKAISLPLVGSDNGCLLADIFVINNASGNTLPIYASTGVVISCTGSNNSTVSLTTHTSINVYPISTTQWIGVKGS